MRVLLISHSCHARNEGQQRAQRLARLPGVDLRVLVPDRWKEYGSWRKIHVPENPEYAFQLGKVMWPWSGPGQWYLHWYPELARTLRTFKPDIIDLWEEPWGLVSVHACWLRSRLLPHAKIVTETEANIDRTHPIPFRWFRTYTLRRTDYAVARQSEGIGVLRSKGYKGPVKVIGNAVDTEIYRPLNREACRRALGVSGFVAGYVGRITEAKGLMDMVEALALCPPEVNLLFVGSGPFQGALERRLSELRLSDRVRFLPPRALEALPEAMNAMDALLLVSRTTATWKEQFGRVIIEAHACETPVIGSDSGAIPEVIGDGGLVVPEGNFKALAGAIIRLKNDPAMSREMGAIGRRQVEASYSWERVAEQMRDIYLELMPAQPATASPAIA